MVSLFAQLTERFSAALNGAGMPRTGQRVKMTGKEKAVRFAYSFGTGEMQSPRALVLFSDKEGVGCTVFDRDTSILTIYLNGPEALAALREHLPHGAEVQWSS